MTADREKASPATTGLSIAAKYLRGGLGVRLAADIAAAITEAEERERERLIAAIQERIDFISALPVSSEKSEARLRQYQTCIEIIRTAPRAPKGGKDAS
jgi:hypothetical protein